MRGVEGLSDAARFRDVILPRLRGIGLWKEGMGSGEDVLVVGETKEDIEFARGVSAKVCWCQFGNGDVEECEALGPDYVVDGLEEVMRILEQGK
ncbi:HAD family hydrolase [Aspergillus undulatus]|uniref:HAD family hydrolase n=1 Tax=Aspergillus undulatus TaxID=1810928 RepID=UPI003CCDCB48